MSRVDAGRSNRSIAEELGFPLSTVRRWRVNGPPTAYRAERVGPWRPCNATAYAYLLGVYLGDGHMYRTGRSTLRLGVTLDAAYPEIIEQVVQAIGRVDPEARVRRNAKPGAILVCASSPVWSAAFPQHGPGRKHERPIVLEDWQLAITREHPKALLRGLIHSDGCRCVNRFRTNLPSGRVAEYEYPRYFFTNYSEDILGIFATHCDLIGVRWTRSSRKNISISHRRSVALLDEFVGPKS